MTMFIIVFLALCLISQPTQAITRHYEYITMQNVTRLCHTKSIVTVNGKFPGPPIVTREGDRLLIKVTNHVPNNITLHWHGVRQLRNGWADGPAYITQCPIQSGQTYVYNYTIIGQRGTLWWHKIVSYPFVKPYKEVPIIFGEWFNTDPEDIISQALQSGEGPNVSHAYTINGLPGLLYNCSTKVNTFKLKVKPGTTYLLRMINAALNDELVEADALYVKPFDTKTVLITPGQTTSVLLKTKSKYPNATFLMFARPYVTGQGTFDNSTVAGILEYESPTPHSTKSTMKNPLFKLVLPPLNNTSFATNFSKRLRIGLSTNPCDKNQTCQGPNGTKFAASIDNFPNFPVNPLNWFNYTGNSPNNTMANNGTKVLVLPFNTSSSTNLHGFNFFVVGQGFGNFDSNKDPAKFNLIDPVERNTIGVPSFGWVAIRFLADNPSVWFMHCHLEVHTSWGLKMAWLVLDGKLPNQKLLPPPSDLPQC
ncbi:hypothetical protein R3W88_027778 [Solanum pinnatisectum]|uniref:laccase n=1 Tax=Solanum pinnatisectum TaxID=50273 RepID=A0AAV9LJU9_9SOLN|nr:hypothetical protein R3W88_027778 [Solanum pinnatisectum]